MNTGYIVGDKPRVKATFLEIDTNDPIDPSTVKVIVMQPDGTETTYIYGTDSEVEKISTGVYAIALLLDSSGHWKFLWKGLGTLSGAAKAVVAVRPTGFVSA